MSVRYPPRRNIYTHTVHGVQQPKDDLFLGQMDIQFL